METNTAHTADRPNQVIYLDDAHIEAESKLLPHNLRDLYIWLKTHFREKCARDVGVLCAAFTDVGVTIDKTNWTRILKGRWRIDPRGEETTPCVSAENLRESIEALRKNVRVELLRGRTPFVRTSTFQAIRRFVERKMEKHRVNRLGVIYGPTGTQKTASYKELAMLNLHIKWLEATDNGSVKEFTIRLAAKFGASQNISSFAARGHIYEQVNEDHCIIIDNMQTMMRSRKEIERMGKPADTQPIYQFLRGLQEESGCAVIWSITPESVDQMFNPNSVYHEQFEGRAGGRDGFLKLAAVPPKKDLVQIAQVFGFKAAEKHADDLYKLGSERGRIRRFFEILQEARELSIHNEEDLDMDWIQEVIDSRSRPVGASRKN